MRSLLICLIINLVFLIPAFADFIEMRKLDLPAEGVETLQIDCGAGFLKVKGVKDLGNIEVEAEIVVERLRDSKAEKYVEKYVELSLAERNGRARLVSMVDEPSSFFSSIFSRASIAINLTVRTPVDIALDVDDGSGEIKIENIVGEITIEDGSGDIEVHHTAGNVEIDDGSGEIEVAAVDGNIMVDDGSGDILIKDITGDVDIDDGSGDLIVRRIDGNVVVDDGSGYVRITEVTADVAIINDGSGGCDISHVGGTLRR